jgi:hypothetical protein
MASIFKAEMRFVGIEKLKGQEKNEARRNRPTRNKE